MIDPKLRGIVYATAAAGLLSACGADDIASPGDGSIVVVPPPVVAPPPPPPPPPPPTGPAASCPSGTVDAGTIANRRNCQISGTITGALRLQNLAGTIYSLNGKVQVGQDLGADPNAPTAGAQSGVLTIDAGVTIFGASGADFMVVNRGSQLNVDGSATRPVVMTSRNNVLGTSTASSIGEWGEGIDTRYILRHSSRSPGIYAIHVDAQGERSFLYWRDKSAAREMFALPEMAEVLAVAERASLLYFSLISLAILPEEGRAALLTLAKSVRNNGGRVAYDSNFRRNLWQGLDEARRVSEMAMAVSDIGLPTNVGPPARPSAY